MCGPRPPAPARLRFQPVSGNARIDSPYPRRPVATARLHPIEGHRFVPYSRAFDVGRRGRPSIRLPGAIVVALALLIGCGAPGRSAGLRPPSGPTAAQIADATRFRTTFGLASSEAWIRVVAMDPASAAGLELYGVPLTSGEIAELAARPVDTDDVIDTIDAYGSTRPLEWAGAFVDHRHGGTVTALFIGHLEQHRAEIRRRVHPRTNFEVRLAVWSLEQLTAFRDRVERDDGWMTTADAKFVRARVLVTDNVVELRVSSSDPNAEAVIYNYHQHAPWLRVVSDGVGVWAGDRGTLVVHVRTPSGAVVIDPDLVCVPIPDVRSAWLDGPVWADETGTCRMPFAGVTHYRVEVYIGDPAGVPLAIGEIDLVSGTETTLRIEVAAP